MKQKKETVRDWIDFFESKEPHARITVAHANGDIIGRYIYDHEEDILEKGTIEKYLDAKVSHMIPVGLYDHFYILVLEE